MAAGAFSGAVERLSRAMRKPPIPAKCSQNVKDAVDGATTVAVIGVVGSLTITTLRKKRTGMMITT